MYYYDFSNDNNDIINNNIRWARKRECVRYYRILLCGHARTRTITYGRTETHIHRHTHECADGRAHAKTNCPDSGARRNRTKLRDDEKEKYETCALTRVRWGGGVFVDRRRAGCGRAGGLSAIGRKR